MYLNFIFQWACICLLTINLDTKTDWFLWSLLWTFVLTPIFLWLFYPQEETSVYYACSSTNCSLESKFQVLEVEGESIVLGVLDNISPFLCYPAQRRLPHSLEYKLRYSWQFNSNTKQLPRLYINLTTHVLLMCHLWNTYICQTRVVIKTDHHLSSYGDEY